MKIIGQAIPYRFSTPVALALSAGLAVVIGVWGVGSLSLEILEAPAGNLILLFVGFVSALLWVSAAIWFRESQVRLLGAVLFGVFSPLIGVLPFGFVGVWVLMAHPFRMTAFGGATGFLVHALACARTSNGRAV